MAKRKMSRSRPVRSRRYRRRYRRNVLKRAAGRYFVLKQKVNLNTLTVNNTGNLTGAFTFAMSQVPDAANVQQLYDEFKITRVKLILRPTANVAQAASGQFANPLVPGSAYSGLGLIHTSLDYNDGTAPASAQAVVNYRNSRTTRSNKVHIRTIAPKAQGSLFRGVLPGYFPIKNAWIPVAYADTPHYAIKYCLEGGPGDPTFTSFQVAVQVQYTIVFRNQH